MQQPPETRESLLLQIREPENREAWEEFVEIYRPVVFRMALAKGLQHVDALDLVQTVFISIAGSISKWEKRDGKTRFRNWLLRIAKNATLNALTRRPPDQAIGGDTVAYELVNHAAEDSNEASQLDLEYGRQIYLRAAEQVRNSVNESTWQAFELTAVQGISIASAASELGKSVGVIYAARSRVMKQLAAVVSKLEESYE
ncbi:MAG: RNA polymerase sigma factor [Planctomycetota bacterium]